MPQLKYRPKSDFAQFMLPMLEGGFNLNLLFMQQMLYIWLMLQFETVNTQDSYKLKVVMFSCYGVYIAET